MATYDVFISYAWGNPATRAFVHSLAAHLHLAGFNVGIDIEKDYGTSLSGFMSQIAEARHVLLILDENYIHRADTMPDSGVGKETAILQSVITGKPENWLSFAFVDQGDLPKWLSDRNPKGFRFDLEGDRRYGSAQLEDLWRWIADLPADKGNSISPVVIRERLARLERIDNRRDPGRYVSPGVKGRVRYEFHNAPKGTYTVGYGENSFAFSCSGKGANTVYFYKDYVHSVGLLPPEVPYAEATARLASEYLVPGRSVTLFPTAQFVMQNKSGVICTGIVNEIEVYRDPYKENRSYIDFSYRIIIDE